MQIFPSESLRIFLNLNAILAATQLFFHSFAEKVVAKLMADLFLFAFLYLARRFDSVLPQHKGNDQKTENTESLISDAIA